MVNETVYGGRRGHGVLEDGFPLREREVAGDHHTGDGC